MLGGIVSTGVGGSDVGGSGVAVSGGGGTGVAVSGGGGIGVSVSWGVAVGTKVWVGGIGVFVLVGIGILVRVAGTAVALEGGRDRLVTVGVAVKKRLGVLEGKGEEVEVEEGESVLVGIKVGEGTKAVTACWVNAATVSMFEKAKSTILMGCSVTAIWLLKSLIAIAETLHSRLIPITPAARIPRGPAYSLAFTLVFLLHRYGAGCGVGCVTISVVLAAFR